MSFDRYVAIGDSQSEGVGDPDGRGGFRGWADRFAVHLASSSPALRYANLAVRGRQLGAIRGEQLAPAQALDPDLVTVMGGLNDVLRPGFDLDAVLAELSALLRGFPGATVLTNTFPDPRGLTPLAARLAPRVEAYNEGIRASAATHGAVVVDFARRGSGADPRIWSPDRLHANPVGHSLIAAAFADAVGLPGFGGWADPLPPAVAVSRGRQVRREAAWTAGFLVPWLGRRVRGRSSGDGVTAKRPQLLPAGPLFHLLPPDTWSALAGRGALRPPSLAAEGFVHLSFAHQVTGSADRHLADAPALVALEIDAAAAGAPVVIEDSYGSGTAFPHLYGPLPAIAVTRVHPLRRVDSHWVW